MGIEIKDENINRLTLMVIKKNHGAKKLYERFGFTAVGQKDSKVLALLSGIEGSYFMKKYLPK